MKKILVVLLFVIFFIGVYLNFGADRPLDQLSLTSSNDNSAEESTNETDEDTDENNSENGNQSTSNDGAAEAVTFSQPALNEKFEDAAGSNEPLIIDLLLPSYYNDDFTDRLTEMFGSNNVQFNRQELDVNSTDLSEVSISDNSDAVIIDALQIQDYNDEVLFDRSEGNITDVYLNIFNDDRVAYILGNPNVHEHENLAGVLEDDADYFSENDYYYIDNQDLEVSEDYDYDAELISASAEDQIIQNIYDYLVE
ncbi:hypothetical protein [Corticicoccus populi]|uniref:Uncharacterized protein n=1 Tax=Corticicoccus populi TaxID=1812821 RepID=A0ABW5WY43_9STAP